MAQAALEQRAPRFWAQGPLLLRAEAGAETSPHVQGRRPAPQGAVGARRAFLRDDERDRRPVWGRRRRGEMERKEVPAPAGADRWLRREGRLRWLRGCRCFRFWCAATGRCRSLPPPLRSAPGPSAPPPPGRPPLPPPSSCSHGGSRVSGRCPPRLRWGHLPSSPSHPAVIN